MWTAKAKESHLGQVGWAVEGNVVNDGFLRVQPLSIEEGIDMGLWRIWNKTGQLLSYKLRVLDDKVAPRTAAKWKD